MKKSDLKAVIKPIVKECIQEVLIEEGMLSGVVSEVVKGLQSSPIVETQSNPPPSTVRNTNPAKTHKRLNEQRKSLMDAISRDAYNGADLFEGTTPLPSASPSQPGSIDMGAPEDPGVDISSIMGQSSHIWKAMK